MQFDGLVLLSYGGPNKPDDVMPFLRNATGGRGVPDERLEHVAQHYFLFGGKSPINALNADLAHSLRTELTRRGVNIPLVIGNRNWTPYVTDALSTLYDAGARNVLAIPTSAYHSYSSSIQYQEDIDRALGELTSRGITDLSVTKAAPYYDRPAFASANARAIREAMGDAPARIAFVTHSIPLSMEESSGTPSYRQQHMDVIAAILEQIPAPTSWDLVYCSRSGSPRVPWLEPDINDYLESSEPERTVIAPIGFISDHMEVAYDLDTQARATCERLGIQMVRSATVGTDPAFISLLADIVTSQERISHD
ncbi:MAG: ferrochelatase [Actinomycetaceae bacterium]|nr:ferrochelatase [Actinomycetaceae bacterium]